MTVKQQETVDTIKAWAFPALLTVVIYFLNQVMTQLERVESRLDDLHLNQRVIQTELQYLKIDTSDMRSEIESLKKSLEKEYLNSESHVR